jgi:hypothetical protein
MAGQLPPGSYSHLINDENFPDGNTELRIRDRYETAFIDIQTLLEKYGLIECCTVNPRLLWDSTLDYFADIAHLKASHGHQHVQAEKIYAYTVFWLLRNHPIQIDNPDSMPDEYIHINEYIFSFWLIKNLATKLASDFAPNIQVDDLTTIVRRFR